MTSSIRVPVRLRYSGALIVAALIVLMNCVNATAAFAQAQSMPPEPHPKWEVEIHGGPNIVVNPPDGTGVLPPAGTAFKAVNNSVTAPVPSWFFGDGAVILNKAATTVGGTPITSLDTVLAGPSAKPKTGLGFGVRVSRIRSRHVTYEASVDWRGGNVEVTKDALTAIETTRSTYQSAFQSLLGSSAAFQNTGVTATTAIVQNSAHQLLATGAIDLSIYPDNDRVPFLIVGGGVLTSLGDAPTVTLVGRYTTRVLGVAPIDETDTVSLRYGLDRHTIVTMIGVGWKHSLSPRFGVRLDLREHLSGNRVRNIVDVNPTVATTSVAGQQTVAAVGPLTAVQFSNIPKSPLVSSLSGAAVSAFTTFTGTGLESRFLISGGLFIRF